MKKRIYVETELMGANVGWVDSEQGLVLIDTPYLPDEIQQWKDATAKLSNREIAYVINTHHHFDHCLGNALLSPNVVAHQSTYEETAKPDGIMRHYFLSTSEHLTAEVKKQIYDLPIGLPRFTFNDRIMHPYKGQTNFRQWIEGLERIQEMDIDLIVSGHGDICHKADAKGMLEYFNQMWDRVLALRREGCAKDKVVERTHDLIAFYPIEPGTEEEASMMFDEGTARLYDEIEAHLG